MTASPIADPHDRYATQHLIALPDDGVDKQRHRQLLDALNLNEMHPDDSLLNDRPMSPSCTLDGILNEGDLVGEGVPLQGQILSRVKLDSIPSSTTHSHSRTNSISTCPTAEDVEPTSTFQVVRKLGTGSYAIVYQVREVLAPPSAPPSSPSDDGSCKQDEEGMFDFESASSLSCSPPSSPRSPDLMTRKPAPQLATGREFAIKVLSKANLDADALSAQLLEATLHQSLPIHPNIVTLHRTLESSAFLILVLEYVPGQDLFYFLEQSRDHYEVPSSPPLPQTLSKTPTTPSLLAALHPSNLLSHTRLRLIASMFNQMCDAVAACHAQGIYHRDIKPENFIVTEAYASATNSRKVVVKLSDFGLATTDEESADMDCGSAPYMSYECRNNLAPTYAPREADVWSLGIVLINMLYHYNPWTDTSLLPEHKCPSFESYLQADKKDDFFLNKFTGMTKPVASFLANRVFSFVVKGEERASAEEFGEWARGLPELFGRDASTCALPMAGLTIGRVGRSRRPSLRSGGPSWIAFGRIDRASSRGRQREREEESGPPMPDPEIDDDDKSDDDAGSRAASTNRRRKRGARNKSKGAQTPKDEEFSSIAGSERDREMRSELAASDKLDDMAVRSQLLARELSKASSWLSNGSSRASASTSAVNVNVITEPELPEPADPKGPERKGWKRLWRMASSDNLSGSRSDTLSPPPPVPPLPTPPHTAPSFHQPKQHPYPHSHIRTDASKSSGALSHSSAGSAQNRRKSREHDPVEPGIAANVTSIVNGLSAQPARQPRRPQAGEDRGRASKPVPKVYPPTTWGPSPRIEYVPRPSNAHPNPYNTSVRRAQSPSWRNSMATTTSSSTTSTNLSHSSAFTKFSNGSVKSLDTVATSASGHSSKLSNWRSGADGKEPPSKLATTSGSATASSPTPRSPTGSSGTGNSSSPTTPANIKMMNGIPWELHQLPRQLHHRPEGDIFGTPPSKMKNSDKQGRPPRLEPISEQQQPHSAATSSSWRKDKSQTPPAKTLSPTLGQRRDASTSTTDLEEPLASVDEEDDGASTKKVRKGQINALAKMLSGLRR